MKFKKMFLSGIALSVGILSLASCSLFEEKDNIPSEIISECPHLYETSYSWNTRNNSGNCTATATCSKCDDIITEAGEIETEILSQPTCISGQVKYTATFSTNIFSTQTKKVQISATQQHTLVQDKGYAATYTSTGLTDGTHCSVCNKIITAQETIPVLKDEYTLSFEWASDNSSCSAYKTSIATKEKTLIETKTSVKTETKATCSEKGSEKYTVTFTSSDISSDKITQEKTIETPTLEHKSKTVSSQNSTYFEEGTTYGTKCELCDTILTGCSPISKVAPSFNYSSVDVSVPPYFTDSTLQALNLIPTSNFRNYFKDIKPEIIFSNPGDTSENYNLTIKMPKTVKNSQYIGTANRDGFELFFASPIKNQSDDYYESTNTYHYYNNQALISKGKEVAVKITYSDGTEETLLNYEAGTEANNVFYNFFVSKSDKLISKVQLYFAYAIVDTTSDDYCDIYTNYYLATLDYNVFNSSVK